MFPGVSGDVNDGDCPVSRVGRPYLFSVGRQVKAFNPVARRNIRHFPSLARTVTGGVRPLPGGSPSGAPPQGPGAPPGKKAVQTLPIAVKGANRLKFTPDGKRVLISGLGAGSGGISLVVMDASARKEVKQLNLGGGAAGILIAPNGSRAYVAVSTNDKVAVVDLKTLEVVGQISAGKQPDGLAWAVRK